MILACQNIEKSFDGVTLLADASFHIEEREKAALVGITGQENPRFLKSLWGNFPRTAGRLF